MTFERLLKFSKREHLFFIGSELERARVWQNKDEGKFKSALERVLELIDLMLNDKRWHSFLSALFWLRQELAKFYIGENKYDIEILYKAL
ncbi:MAG: hypothetical protein AAB851_01625 [Patescibacteria group bacterium]|mgnify:FL=1